jgi:hypothetical protein
MPRSSTTAGTLTSLSSSSVRPLGDAAEHLDLHALDGGALGEGHGQAAEQAGQRHERAEHLAVLGGDRGQVHRGGHRAAVQRGGDLLGGLQAGAVGGLRGGGAQVRGDDDVGVAEERVVGDRLGAEDVERRAGDLAGVQRVLERLVDDERAAGHVEHAHAVLHLREGLRVEPALGLRRLGQVQREEVRHGVDVVGGRRLLHAQLAVALGPHEGVEGHDAHAEPLCALGDELADAPEAEHPEHLVLQLHPGVLRALPAALHEGGVGLGDVAREGEQQRERVLGRGHHVGLRSVGHDDAALRRRGDVDVVDAHPGAPDRAQARGVLEQRGVDLRGRADEQAVERADALGELVGAQAGGHVDLEALVAQERDAGVPDLLRDEDLRHARRSTTQSMHAVSACTSSGSIAGNMPTRSWLRPSLR